jgi:hypothetical protein
VTPKCASSSRISYLVGVRAPEAIDARAQHPVEHARLGGIAQAIKRRAIQPRTRVAIVDDLLDHLIPIRPGRCAQQLQLGADRAPLVLALGRNARIEPDPHAPTASDESGPAQTSSKNA